MNSAIMLNYSYDTITVNNRKVKLEHIVSGDEKPASKFESSAFTFIQQWFGLKATFTQQTSGSTGPPKNIEITRDQMTASALLTKQALILKSGETAFVCLDPAYIAGKMMLVRSFVVDMKIVLAEPKLNPFEALSESDVDFTAFVPLQLAEVFNSATADRLNTIKSILIGGAALAPELVKLTSSVASRIYATYGMTETVSHIALQRVNGPEASEFFTALPGINVLSDERGCLVIRAPYLDAQIVTNDLVDIVGEKRFKWLGRVDNVINTGGVKVVPEQIELRVHKIFDSLVINNNFFICGIKDRALGQKVILVVEGYLDDASIKAIQNGLRRVLQRHENPKEVVANVQFVRTATGKVNRDETLRRVVI